MDEKPERGVFAKRISTVGEEVRELRRALILVANALTRAGYVQPEEQARLMRLLTEPEPEGDCQT